VEPTTYFCAGSRNVLNYYDIIIGHNSTDSIFNRPTVRRRADDIVAAERLAMLLCSSESVDKQYSELQEWRELLHERVKQPKRETYYSLK
jgi:hypothetical protein